MTDSISHRLDIRLQLRQAMRKFGERVLSGAANLDATGQLPDAAGAMRTDTEGRNLTDLQGLSSEVIDPRPLLDNLDPWKVRIPRRWRSGWERMQSRWAKWQRMLALLRDSDLPLLTRYEIFEAGRLPEPDELAQMREDAENRKNFDFHVAQAERGRRTIINTLTRLGFCDSVEREGKRLIRREVDIPNVDVSPLAYVYSVNGANLPRGVDISKMYDDDVCTNLSVAVGHPVRSDIRKVENTVIGLRYIVEIAATLGIPNVCKFADMYQLVPASAPPLAFIVGYAQGKRPSWSNLERLPHFLGGGQTNGGKSNMLHVIACSLIARNTPDVVRLVMIDLKFQGIELLRYAGLPHLVSKREDAEPQSYIEAVPSGIAINAEQAMSVLRWALAEAERRGQLLTKHGARDLRQWNHKHPHRRMPYIVIIQDELGALRLDPDKEIANGSHILLQRLLAQGRAAGIHFVAFTQTSGRRVLDEMSKINMPGRICFSTPDTHSSQLFIGDGSARGLTPAGRAIFAHGTDRYMVQTPLIEPGDIAEIISNARQGKMTTHLTAREITAEEIIDWAVEHNQSNLSVRDVYGHFGSELHRIERQPLLNKLKEMDGHEYTVGDRRFRVLHGIGSRARTLETLDMTENAGAATPDSKNGTQNTDEPSLPACPWCEVELSDPFAKTCPKCGGPLEGDS